MEEKNAWPAVMYTRAADYRHETMAGAVRRQFELLGITEEFIKGKTVTLKPNLLMKREPERFTTTHPMLVRCVVEELRRLGAGEVTIADSPGGPYTHAALEGIYRASGMEAAAQEAGAVLNRDLGYEEARCGEFLVCPSFNLIRPVRQAQVLINLPKLKTHCMTTLSGGVKNLFGCVPGLQKPELHYRFPQEEQFCSMLLDLCRLVSPDFTIVDAVESMEGDGPSGGSCRRTGFLAGCRSPFVLDAALSRLLCLGEVPTVRIAAREGLGPGEKEEIPYLGEKPEAIPDFKKPRSKSLDFMDALPAFLRPLVQRLAVPAAQSRPRVHKKQCIGCGKCMQSCPAKTIRVVGGKAQILPEKCIRCYCCHEMCPVGAIHIRRLRLFDL